MADEPVDLEAIRARLDAATEGPWMSATNTGRKDGIALVGRVADRGTGNAIAVFAEASASRHADAVFTAHARTDIPALIAEVERLREDLAVLGRWDCAACEACPGVNDEGLCHRCGGPAEWWEPDTITSLRADTRRYREGKNEALAKLAAAERERNELAAEMAKLRQPACGGCGFTIGPGKEFHRIGYGGRRVGPRGFWIVREGAFVCGNCYAGRAR